MAYTRVAEYGFTKNGQYRWYALALELVSYTSTTITFNVQISLGPWCTIKRSASKPYHIGGHEFWDGGVHMMTSSSSVHTINKGQVTINDSNSAAHNIACDWNISINHGTQGWLGVVYGNFWMHERWTDPSFTGSITFSDNTPATGNATGSGTVVNWSYSGSWGSASNGDRNVYIENFKGDGNQYWLDASPNGWTSDSRSYTFKDMPSDYNNIRMHYYWRDSNGNERWTHVTTAWYTMHTYSIPTISASQTVSSNMIAGTSSISVPYRITSYNTGDTGSTGNFRHIARMRRKNDTNNTDLLQQIDISKSVHNGTSTFNSGLSSLKPNDSFRIYINRNYETSTKNNYADLEVISNTVLVIHREPGKPTSVSYTPKPMVEGYTYDIDLKWNNTSDWGTRTGSRMIDITYVTNRTDHYSVSSTEANNQHHKVITFTPPVTGTNKTTQYYIDIFSYITNTSNKSDTVRVNIPVAARIKPSATNISLSGARVTTQAKPTVLMADTPNWGNTQVSSSRMATYDLYIDGTFDSSHYVKPGESKQITAKNSYAWGDHTAYVKAKYSSDLGDSSVYTTNTIDIEIGDYPVEPAIAINPYSWPAGQNRKFTWTITPGNWCLSLGRKYTYVIKVGNTVVKSGTKPANTTKIEYQQIYRAATTCTLYIKQTNDLGDSDEVESIGIIGDPTPPTKSTIEFTTAPLGLPDQIPVIGITRESNGTYEQNRATIKVEFIKESGQVVSTPVSERNIGMQTTSYTMPKVDLSSYMGGDYYYRVTYKKYFTTGDNTTTTVFLQVIIPPDIEIDNNTWIDKNTRILHIDYDIRNTFDKVLPYYIEYSLDYKKTWIRLPNKMKYNLQCDYLDEIYTRAYGMNPVDSELTDPAYYEMPTRYHYKRSDNGGVFKLNRRLWASSNGGAMRKSKRIIKP